MAPYPARLGSARKMARHAPIRVSDVEVRLRTRYTADTLTKLPRVYPRHRFIWLMGADNLAEFHRWRDWRKIARQVPIAVIARPGYNARAHASPAMSWLRRAVRPAGQAKKWTSWRLPGLVLLRFRPDPTSATRIRAADPAWHRHFSNAPAIPISMPSVPSPPSRTDLLQP
jgi:nicotinate-nucleotide adenylyltransferase